MAKTFNSDLHWVNEGRDVKEKGHKGGGTLPKLFTGSKSSPVFYLKIFLFVNYKQTPQQFWSDWNK